MKLILDLSIILLIYLSFSGCAIFDYSDIKRHSNIKYSLDKSLPNKIRFDGYYRLPGDSYTIFYKDGSVSFEGGGIHFSDSKQINAVAKIVDDTLFINQYRSYSKLGAYLMDVTSFKFLIGDERTLWLLNTKLMEETTWSTDNDTSLFKHVEISNPLEAKLQNLARPYSFYPLDSVPVYDNPLKEKKWMWENKEDWKQWKKEQKRLKKEGKR